jgi:hypothetical protein
MEFFRVWFPQHHYMDMKKEVCALCLPHQIAQYAVLINNNIIDFLAELSLPGDNGFFHPWTETLHIATIRLSFT